jgi:murein DD-endopeptidase MepM/ murein hydrolase activator NlpD
MLKTKFRYNPESLRYERVKISVFNVLITLLGYLSFGVLFFVGLLLLQNYIIETPTEKQFRSENESLKQHKVLLAGQLTESNYLLEELQKQDQELYEKLFEVKQPLEEDQTSTTRGEILLAETSDFNTISNDLNNRFNSLYASAKSTNQYFRSTASVKKEDISTLFSIPSIVPVANFDLSKLVSGFGTRINPFHKGHYHHDGVDIASPRGTHVLAGGNGQVITIKRSELLAGYGNYIEIDHGHGIITRYSHLEEITVRQGQNLKKGDFIGTVGSSGGSIAPHLHYEVIQDGSNIDPLKFFAEGLNAELFQELVTKSKKQNQSLD